MLMWLRVGDLSIAALRHRLLALWKRPFIRSVAAVTSGSIISQALGLVFAPIVTRLFGPQAYGVQSVFVTAAGILTSIAALSYPIAIVLPRRDADAIGIVRLSMYIGVALSVLAAVVLYFVGDALLALLDATEISRYSYLIPVFMVSSIAGLVVSQWLIRKQLFALTAKVSVVATALTGLLKTGVGLVSPSAISLICANMIGGLVATGLMAWIALRSYRGDAESGRHKSAHGAPDLLQIARRHIDFPLYRTPQNLLNAVSAGMPVGMLAAYFGSASAAFYSLASSVLVLPAGLIGSSVMQVFYPRITEAIHSGEDSRSLVRRATYGLAATGAVPFLVLMAAGPSLFDLVFGAQWRQAGVYAQLLSPWLFLQYINKPAVAAIPALGLQGALLVYEIFSAGSKALALVMGFFVFRSDFIAVGLFSLFGVIAYVWLILWVLARCGRHNATIREGMD